VDKPLHIVNIILGSAFFQGFMLLKLFANNDLYIKARKFWERKPAREALKA
jgi:hypothetical protein